jgi:putative membrane protein
VTLPGVDPWVLRDLIVVVVTGMHWHDHGMGGWGYGLMVVGFVLFWGLVIAGLVLLVRYLRRGDRAASATPPPPSAEQVLAERFARGDIDEDEYRKRLQVLRGSP